MESSRTILKKIKDINSYLSKYPTSKRSTYYEKFIIEVISRIFYLPFYSIDKDKTSINYRVVWQGTDNPIEKAPSGADGIGYCYNYKILFEATQKTGTRQWSQEFSNSIQHCEDFCNDYGIQEEEKRNKLFSLLIVTDIHEHTYNSIKSQYEYKIIPIEIIDLIVILNTSILAFTMRHSEIKRLLNDVEKKLKESPSLEWYRNEKKSLIKSWQIKVLDIEKNAFIGVNSYNVMNNIGQKYMGMSEILKKLQNNPFVRQYLNIIGKEVNSKIISNSLINNSFAYILGRTFDDEEIFELIPFPDIKGRNQRLIERVNKI